MFGVFFVVKAMDKKTEVVAEPTKSLATTTYFYNGPSTSLDDNVVNPDHWSTIPSHQCGTPTDIPCRLDEVPEDMSIEDFLDNLGSPSAIRNASVKGRTP
ncbi:hypothetical protein [Sphingobacterium daejeonense]|uniref:hypothetical protein n=1 Tax=Sphingobacterium daejeonense TaxID=371142 RepID=UPI003D3154A0